MIIGVLQLDLQLPGAQSLKDKRMMVRSIKDKVRREFNVSIAEVADHDLWQSAVLAVVMVSTDQSFANQVLSKVVERVTAGGDWVVVDYHLTFL